MLTKVTQHLLICSELNILPGIALYSVTYIYYYLLEIYGNLQGWRCQCCHFTFDREITYSPTRYDAIVLFDHTAK